MAYKALDKKRSRDCFHLAWKVENMFVKMLVHQRIILFNAEKG